MKPAAVFAISLALAATIASALPSGPALAWSIPACQTISQPGSYILTSNITASSGNCLVITASFVTIDLQGFTITATGFPGFKGIYAASSTSFIAVRNGSISGFTFGVDLEGTDSIVERLRVSVGFGPEHMGLGIEAYGIVKNNVVSGDGVGIGISAGGIVSGNNQSFALSGITVEAGSTVIGNTSTNNNFIGIDVVCPSNVTNNTAVGNANNLGLTGAGCNNTNNVAPPSASTSGARSSR